MRHRCNSLQRSLMESKLGDKSSNLEIDFLVSVIKADFSNLYVLFIKYPCISDKANKPKIEIIIRSLIFLCIFKNKKMIFLFTEKQMH